MIGRTIFVGSKSALAALAILVWLLLPLTPAVLAQPDCGPSGSPQWRRNSLDRSGSSGHALGVDTARGRVVLFGGIGTSNALLSTTLEFDGMAWTARSPVVSPPARHAHEMAYDAARGKLVMFGGTMSTASGAAGLSDTWEYDGTTWTQRSPVVSPPARFGHAMAFDPIRGKVVLFGGSNGSVYLADHWEYDGTTWTQRNLVDRPEARTEHTMAFDASRGRIVLFGGVRFTGVYYSDTWEFNGEIWIQRSPSASPSGRYGHTIAYDAGRLGGGKVVLFGGRDATGAFLSDTWEYDGSVWTQRNLPVNPPPILASSMVYVAGRVPGDRGRVVLVGGLSNSFVKLADTWEYDGTTWTRLILGSGPPSRERHAMAFDAGRAGGGRVVLFGGSVNITASTAALADTWEFDGVMWTQRSPATSPPARELHAMAYDAGRVGGGRIVLFGGSLNTVSSSAALADTWEYDGTTWTQRVPAASPPGRYGHAMAYDSARSRIVLFGGFRNNQRLSDTWEYDGTTWTQRSPIASPSARQLHAMTYDTARGQIVLFGGFAGLSLSDTWEYDGTTWTRRSPIANPPGRHLHSMVDYAGRPGGSRVVLFGGTMVPTFSDLSDTWEYDGTTWTQRGSAANPNARNAFAMAYILSHPGAAGASKVVLFGGGDNSSEVFSDTWEFGTLTPVIRRQPVGRFVVAGQYTDLNVVADGTTPLTYQWSRNSVPLSNTSNVTGATSNFLQVAAISTAEVGLYTCAVTDACGNTIVSAIAAVAFCPADFDANGTLTAFDIFDFLNAWFATPQDPRANFDGLGGIDAADIFAFLNAWFAGC